ncbi:MAG: FHIPEP family type III secretion protein [Bryobacteraceae bacterium]
MQNVSGAPVLSVEAIDLGESTTDTTAYEHLAVFALGILSPSSTPPRRIVLRFITPGAMRSAGRDYSGRWSINDIAIATPEGLEHLSFLLYRVRRSTRVDRRLALFEKTVEIAEQAGDDDNLVLGRAILEQLEALDDGADAKVILSGSGLRFASSSPRGDERHLAVLAVRPEDTVAGSLWLTNRKLHRGADLVSATPVAGRPYAVLRLGSLSTSQSMRDFIAEIRRRHQQNREHVQAFGAAVGESFSTFVERHQDSQKSSRLENLSVRFGRAKKGDTPFIVTPLRVEVGSDIVPMLSDGTNLYSEVQTLIETMREETLQSVGFKPSGVRFQGNPNLPGSQYGISIKGNLVDRGTVHPNKRWCKDAAVADAGGLKTVSGFDPETGLEISWLDTKDSEKVQAAGYACHNAISYLIHHVAVIFRKYMHELITIDDIVALLKPEPALLLAVRNAPRGLPSFFAAICALLRESVPIRSWQAVANGYLELIDGGFQARDLVEELRMLSSLRSALPGNAGDTRLLLIRGPFTEAVRTGVIDLGIFRGLMLEPDVAASALAELRSQLAARNAPMFPVVVVADADLRPHFWRFLRYEIPGIQVLSLREVLHRERVEEWEEPSV